MDNKDYLVLADAFSQSPEDFETSSTTTAPGLDILRSVFRYIVLTNQLVSDKRPQLVSQVFKVFCAKHEHRVQFIQVTPLSSNGAAEVLCDHSNYN